jgi:ABC-2 type transport system permease protein
MRRAISTVPPAQAVHPALARNPDGAPDYVLRAAWSGLHEALSAEWTKLRTLPGTFWLLAAVVATTVAVSTAAAAAVSCPHGGCSVDPAKVSLTGIYLGQAVAAILGVLVISGEYSTGMIRATITAMPGRTTVLAAKAAIIGGLALAAGAIAVAGSLLAGRALLTGHGFTPAHGYPALTLGDGPVLRAAAGSVLYLALIALLSLGVATIIRDPAPAIGTVLGLLYLDPIIAAVLHGAHWHNVIERYAPMTAGLAIQATTGLSSLPISPWAGLGVLAAWAAGALLLGGLLLRLRDA